MCTLNSGTKATVHFLWTQMSVVMPRPRTTVRALCSLIFPDLEVTDWEEGPTLPTLSCQGSPRQIWEF